MPDQSAINKLCLDKKICPRRFNEQRKLKKNNKKMTYFVFAIDEVVLLTTNNECKHKLHEIMCHGRKAGIYFILCLQDATKDTIGKCKMQSKN